MMSSEDQRQDLFQKLAVARRRYQSLEPRSPGKAEPVAVAPTAPSKKIVDCVFDYSALIAGFGDVKKWLSNGSITLVIPICVLDELVEVKEKEEKKGGQNTAIAADVLAYLARRSSKSGNAGMNDITVQENSEKFQPWSRVEMHLYQMDEPETATEEQAIPEKTRLTRSDPPPADTIIEAETPPDSSGDVDETIPSLASLRLELREQDAGSLSNTLNKDALAALPGQRLPETSQSEYERALLERVNGYLDKTPSIPDDMYASFPYVTQELLNCIVWRMKRRNASTESNRLVLVTIDPETRYWASKFDIPVKDLEELSKLISLEYKDYKSRLNLYNRQNSKSDGAEEMLRAATNSQKRSSRDMEHRPKSSSHNKSESWGHKRNSGGSFDKTGEMQPKASPRRPSTATSTVALTVEESRKSPHQGRERTPSPAKTSPTTPEVIDPNSFSRSPAGISHQLKPSSMEDAVAKKRNNTSWRRGRGGGRLWVPGK